MQRKHTTKEQRKQFREYLRQKLVSLNPAEAVVLSAASDAELCQRYDNLSQNIKYGFWSSITEWMGKKSKWATHYYGETFRRTLYDEFSSDQKERVAQYLKNACINLAEVGKCELVEQVISHFELQNVFKNSVQSFVYQELNRMNNWRPRSKGVPKRAPTEGSIRSESSF